jgi:hypothetical protein
MAGGCIDPIFLDLGTSWRWVVSFVFRPLYTRGKSSRYSSARRLVGPRAAVDHFGKRKLCTLPERELRSLIQPDLTIPTALSRLLSCDILLLRSSCLHYETGNVATLMLPGNKRVSLVLVRTCFVTYKII